MMADFEDDEHKQPEPIVYITDWTGEWDDAGAYWQSAFDSVEGVHPGLCDGLKLDEREAQDPVDWGRVVLEEE